MKFLRPNRFGKLGASLAVFAIVFLCLFLEWWWAEPAGREQRVCAVVASKVDLKAGEIVSSRRISVHFEPAPAGRRCEELFFVESQLDSAEWVTTRDIRALEPLFFRDVKKRRKMALPRGLRAYSVKFASAVEITPGDHIEVYSVAFNRPIATSVLVLESSISSIDPPILDLVLALRQMEIRDMEKAVQKGTLSLALVHPADVRASSFSFGKNAGKKSKPVRARIWHEE